MRILQLGGLAGPGPVAGGVWRVAETQTALLRDRGHTVHLFGLWLDDNAQDDGDNHYLAARPPFPGAGYRGLLTRGLKEALLAHGPYHVAHIHLARDFATTRALRILAGAGVPIVVQTHGMISPATKRSTQAFDLLFKPGTVRLPNLWLSLTQHEDDDLAAYGARNILRVPNPVLSSGFSWQPDRERYLLFASRLHPRKQADVLVRAVDVALASHPDLRLVIAGPDEGGLDAVRQAIAGSSAPHRFEIAGPLPQAQVRDRLSRAYAMVLPSKGEVAPMIAIESCEIGTPMVLTADCGLSEGLNEQRAAVIADPEVAPLAEAIGALWADRADAERLSAAAHAYYQSHWSPETVGAELEAAYSTVVHNHPGGDQ